MSSIVDLVYRGNVREVRTLLASGVDVNWRCADGWPLLHYAVMGGHVDTLKLLLRYRPPLEAKNCYGGTVLGQAVWSAIHEPR